jgi:hypothetical protein
MLSAQTFTRMAADAKKFHQLSFVRKHHNGPFVSQHFPSRQGTTSV